VGAPTTFGSEPGATLFRTDAASVRPSSVPAQNLGGVDAERISGFGTVGS